jgi:hemolysin activation/secretion protein
MKAVEFVAAAVFLLSLAAPAQEQPSSSPEEQRPQQGQQSQPRRPTLGPAPAPSLYGPKTSSTTDPRKLVRVHKIYIERMDNALDEKLTERLANSRRFQLVGERKEADAVLRGTCFDSRRLKLLRSEVYLNDPGGVPIWQDSLRRPLNPPALATAVSDTANLIASHLSESVTEAERH